MLIFSLFYNLDEGWMVGKQCKNSLFDTLWRVAYIIYINVYLLLIVNKQSTVFVFVVQLMF